MLCIWPHVFYKVKLRVKGPHNGLHRHKCLTKEKHIRRNFYMMPAPQGYKAVHKLCKRKILQRNVIISFHEFPHVFFQCPLIKFSDHNTGLKINVHQPYNILIYHCQKKACKIIHHLIIETSHYSKIMEAYTPVIKYENIPRMGVSMKKTMFKYLH